MVCKKADTQHLTDIPGPNPSPAVITINALQAVYVEDSFKPHALKYCFVTKAKMEDVPLVKTQEITWLLGGAITSMMVALATVRQWLQQAATELGEDLTMDIVLPLEDLDGPASTCLMHELTLMDSSFNSLSEKGRKEAVSKLWGN